jgi:hypothetical protein
MNIPDIPVVRILVTAARPSGAEKGSGSMVD